MGSSDTTNTTTTTATTTSSHSSLSPPLSPPLQPPPPVVISPCAACKILRRRCVDKCVLAPYFPPSEPLKFMTAHRVFGASNIIKMLQELPESQRADAVSSMVYEANSRIRDPVYGCAGTICQLHKQVSELQAQLAKAQAEIVNMQCQQANLVALICMEMTEPSPSHESQQQQQSSSELVVDDFMNITPSLPNNGGFLDEANVGSVWEPLWA